MRTLKNWTVEKLAYNDDRCKGYYHCPYILIYKGNEVVLGCGENDYIALFQSGDDIISYNYSKLLPYAGIVVYDNNLNEITELFLQESELYDTLNTTYDKFFGYTELYQAKLLYNEVAYE